jgi:hypothetical protein
MITEEIKKIIESNVLALATTDKKGNPHCIAVGDVKVISNNQILIGNNYMVETIENIKRNPNVALIVWDNKGGYELKGNVEYFNKGKWLNFVKKIHKGYSAKGAILVNIKEIKKLA